MKGPFSADDSAKALNLPLARARRLLSWLENQGWLSRVRRGVYTVVPLGAKEPTEWRADPWVVAAKVFAPCFVGGWSACEHWSLTEQVFRGVVVLSGKPVRLQTVEVQGTPFIVRHRRIAKHFGTSAVWKEGVQTRVSDPSRTLVDILDDPGIGGGIKHVQEVLRTYFDSQHRNDTLLLDYVKRLGNRSVFKRLGHLLEASHIHAPDVVAQCLHEKSSGLTLLDPTVHASGKILKRWNLRLNVRVRDEALS